MKIRKMGTNKFNIVIKNKNFVKLWVSQFLSEISVHTFNFLIILTVFHKTNSAVATSMVWIVFTLPALLIGPLAATFVDLVDKRKILIVTNFLQALTLIMFSLFTPDKYHFAYVVVFLYSLLNQLYVPAEFSSLPRIVHKNYLTYANSLFLITYEIAIVIGASFSGVIADQFGFRVAYFLVGILVFMAFIAVNYLPKMPGKLKNIKTFSLGVDYFISETTEGYKFIAKNKNVFLPFITIVALQVALAIIFVNLPIISEDIINLDANYSGLSIVVPAGVGAGLGIVFTSKLFNQKIRKKRIVKFSLFLMTFAIWALLTVPFLPDLYRLLVAFSLFILVGFSFVGIFITAQTHLQHETPRDYMARVFGNSRFITTAATVVPILFSASITDIFGLRVLLLIFAMSLTLVLVFYEKYV